VATKQQIILAVQDIDPDLAAYIEQTWDVMARNLRDHWNRPREGERTVSQCVDQMVSWFHTPHGHVRWKSLHQELKIREN